MTLYFLTGSKDKVAEVKLVLPEVEQMEMELEEIQELDPHKIIAAKLSQARQSLHHGSIMVEDTSLYLDGMNGLPGPLNKWFLQALGYDGLVKLARAFGATARAVTIIGYADEKGSIEFFEGEVRGTIVEPRGEGTFGWDRIFLPDGQGKTYGEMEPEVKARLSMRRKAVEKLKNHLQNRG